MATADSSAKRYAFADLVLDLGQRRLWRNDEAIPLSRLTFELLSVLVEAAPDLVSHDELAARVWGPRRVVTPENLTQRLLLLRKSLGDDAARPRYIESVRGQGYRLVPTAILEPGEPQADTAPPVPAPRPAQLGRLRERALTFIVVGGLLVVAAAWWSYAPRNESTLAAVNEQQPPARTTLPDSLAVLPFEQFGPEPEDTFFAEMLHAELLNELGRRSSLNVIARASVQHYAARTVPLRRIAQELRVETVMQGSIRYVDDGVRLIAELVDADTGMQVWTDEYRGRLDDIFVIRSELTRSITGALGARLSVDAQGLAELPTKSPEAFTFYMRAMDVFNDNTLGSRATAQTLLDQAIALDPDFAHAYAGKALVHTYALINSPDATDVLPPTRADLVALVRELAMTALAIDPDTDLAHFALAMLDMFSRRWNAARMGLARALELSPQHVEFRSQYAWLLSCVLGETGGLVHVERAVELDPQNPRVHEQAGRVRVCAGDLSGAVAAADRSAELDPTHFGRLARRALLYAGIAERRDEAPEMLANLEPMLTDDRVLWMPPIAMAYRLVGRDDDALRLFRRFSEASQRMSTGPANWVVAYLAIRDYDNALRAFETLLETPQPGPGFMVLIALRRNAWPVPELDSPRFVALRERLGSLD